MCVVGKELMPVLKLRRRVMAKEDDTAKDDHSCCRDAQNSSFTDPDLYSALTVKKPRTRSVCYASRTRVEMFELVTKVRQRQSIVVETLSKDFNVPV